MNFQDVPSDLYKPQTIHVVYQSHSRVLRFLVDLLLLLSLAASAYWFPWGRYTMN